MTTDHLLHGPTVGSRYIALGSEYGRAVEQRLGMSVVVTKKWQNADLVWPHSDIDLRIVVDQIPGDWLQFNEHLAAVQRELVEVDPVRRRLLEHPPGWVFLRGEVDAGFVPAAELATWSICHGDPDTVARWQEQAVARPWTAEDERFYSGILAGRLDGAYHLEADSADNVLLEPESYAAHCVSWHYLAPVVFATASLLRHYRHVGKTDALRGQESTAVSWFGELAAAGYHSAPATGDLLDRAHRAVDSLRQPARSVDDTSAPSLAEVVSAVGALRCRLARYAYYLDPPVGAATGYLIDRETKDLHGATGILRAGLRKLPTSTRSLAERFLKLVPSPPTTRQSLRRFVDNVTKNTDLVNALFSADLTAEVDTIGPGWGAR
jgi:hypothetical protein